MPPLGKVEPEEEQPLIHIIEHNGSNSIRPTDSLDLENNFLAEKKSLDIHKNPTKLPHTGFWNSSNTSDTITTQTIFSFSHSHSQSKSDKSSPACAALNSETDLFEINHNKRKLIIAISLCFVFFLIELIAGIAAGSLAILSDSFHLLSDIAGFGISLSAIFLSQKPATSTHSFGFHRAEILGAILSTFLIWILTAGLVWEAIERLQNPQPINGQVMFYTAAVGVLVNLVLGFTLHGEHDHGDHDHSHNHGYSHAGHSIEPHSHNHSEDDHDHHNLDHDHNHGHDHDHIHNHDREEIVNHVSKKLKKDVNVNIKSAALHVIGDLISSIGVLISAAIIWAYPSMSYIDPLCTFIFSVLVMMTTYTLMMNSLTILMEGTPADINPILVADDLREIDGVVDVHDLHIWTLTVGKAALAVHLDIQPETLTSKVNVPHVTTFDFNRILQTAQELVCSKYGIHHSTIQIEMMNLSKIQPESISIESADFDLASIENQERLGRITSNHCRPTMCRKLTDV
ncbi:Metal tolerance protein 1 [Nowakowskiella sp. JEL0078]|nr:Metal tolerance protein 1 [Nowakowskiella sp. JEL0078]